MIDIGENHDWRKAVELIRDAQHIVVSTGAGISADSGIATFRDAEGFWNRFPPDEFANWKGLLQTAALEPKRFAEFLLAVLEPIASAKPNAGHNAVAELGKHKSVSVITQNIDRLHQEANSHHVYELHGSLFEIVGNNPIETIRVLSRDEMRDIVEAIKVAKDSNWTAARLMKAVQPLFQIGLFGIHRPNIVLFGDSLAEPAWTNAQEAAKECDLFLSVGTSRAVYPAAELPEIAMDFAASVIVIDPLIGGGNIWLKGTASEILPRLIREGVGS